MMIELPEHGLNPEEQSRTVDFFDRLCPDRKNIDVIVGLVDNVANRYVGRQHEFEWAFRRRNGKGYDDGYAFFAVYAVGGNVTKEGERPDLDLLVATNAWWDNFDLMHISFHTVDPFVHDFIRKFHEKNVKTHGDLPNGYNLGATGGKALFTITPPAGKNIDLIYVRSFQGAVHRYCGEDDVKKCGFISEEEFLALDVDESGRPLPRVPLYRKVIPVNFRGQREGIGIASFG